MPAEPLPPDALRPRGLGPEIAFETTDELEDLDEPLGQGRAIEALRLALALRSDGFNAIVVGAPGSGRHALVLQLLERAALDAPTPPDWCYLHDFADPRQPRAIQLPAGRGAELRRELEQLVAELKVALPASFESPDYRARAQLLEKELEAAREAVFEGIRHHAEERHVAFLRTPMGFGFAPLKAGSGEMVGAEEFRALPEAEQERFQRDIAALQEGLREALRAIPEMERKHRERMRALNQEIALSAAGHLLEDLRSRHADLPQVLTHLDAVQAHLLESVHELLAGVEPSELPAQLRKMLLETPVLLRIGVNLLVEHRGGAGAPVVEEDLPSVAGLVGRIEHHAQLGTLVTDFTMIRAGALHRANGGYLLLDARRVLAQPLAWDVLKRALRNREVRVEGPERLLGFPGASTLEPRPIPLDVKVVLVADRLVYHLLSALDPELSPLFKVDADFEDDLPRSTETDRAFARLVATLARHERLPPLDRAAVERLLREACRLADDSTRIATDTAAIHDLLREAAHRADRAGRAVVSAGDVREALEAQARRSGRLHERVHSEIRRGTLVIETAGVRVGQVNGLSVLRLGRATFGRPNRITATVRMGRGEVLDIEREVTLGGPIHSKGVLILAGYLGSRYCSDRPLTLAATIVFEQSYAAVEGDSASSAELYALLSAIGRIPVRQDLAVTGSVDQLGRVQAVGGVTEKVEGFFEVCRERGLTGTEGVLVPATNVPHLVLREDVLAAIEAGRFNVFPVRTIDEGMELLTGLKAGAADASGRFPEGTFDAKVAARLEALAARARAFAAAPRDGAGAREA
jgi:lon-related putative ATP-dependent protease